MSDRLLQAALQAQAGACPTCGKPPGNAMAIAQPFNDTQLVCLLAATMQRGTPAERVAIAMELVAEAIVQMEGGQKLTQLVQKKIALKRAS